MPTPGVWAYILLVSSFGRQFPCNPCSEKGCTTFHGSEAITEDSPIGCPLTTHLTAGWGLPHSSVLSFPSFGLSTILLCDSENRRPHLSNYAFPLLIHRSHSCSISLCIPSIPSSINFVAGKKVVLVFMWSFQIHRCQLRLTLLTPFRGGSLNFIVSSCPL